MSARILVVDDDAAVLSGLRRAYLLADYEVETAKTGEEALLLAEEVLPDLIVLDVVLPGLDGFSVCKRLRHAFSDTLPIIFLSARDAVPDRVDGLDCGADDYLIKPFSVDELLARSRALLRRGAIVAPQNLKFEDLTLDTTAREASRNGIRLPLTRHEFDLLETFLRHPRQVLSREQLCQYVWGFAFEGESNFVDVAVMELRKKLESHGERRIIQTVRGIGYMV